MAECVSNYCVFMHVFKCVTGAVMKWLCKALAAYVHKSVFNPKYESQVLIIISHWLDFSLVG